MKHVLNLLADELEAKAEIRRDQSQRCAAGEQHGNWLAFYSASLIIDSIAAAVRDTADKLP